MIDQIPNESPEILRARDYFRKRRKNVLDFVEARDGFDEMDAMRDRINDHLVALRNRLGVAETNRVTAFNVCIGNSMMKEDKPDFEGADSIALYFAQLEQELGMPEYNQEK